MEDIGILLRADPIHNSSRSTKWLIQNNSEQLKFSLRSHMRKKRIKTGSNISNNALFDIICKYEIMKTNFWYTRQIKKLTRWHYSPSFTVWFPSSRNFQSTLSPVLRRILVIERLTCPSGLLRILWYETTHTCWSIGRDCCRRRLLPPVSLLVPPCASRCLHTLASSC